MLDSDSISEAFRGAYGEKLGTRRVQPVALPEGVVWLKGLSENEAWERRTRELFDRLAR